MENGTCRKCYFWSSVYKTVMITAAGACVHCAVSGYQLANNVASYVHIIIIGQDSNAIIIAG